MRSVEPFFWEIKGASILVGRESPRLPGQTIVFDTTSRFIRGPEPLVKEIYKNIGHKGFHAKLGLYEVPCDTNVNIGLILGHEQPTWMIDPRL